MPGIEGAEEITGIYYSCCSAYVSLSVLADRVCVCACVCAAFGYACVLIKWDTKCIYVVLFSATRKKVIVVQRPCTLIITCFRTNYRMCTRAPACTCSYAHAQQYVTSCGERGRGCVKYAFSIPATGMFVGVVAQRVRRMAVRYGTDRARARVLNLHN